MPPNRATSGFCPLRVSSFTSSTFAVPCGVATVVRYLRKIVFALLMFIRQRLDQRKFHHPMQLPQAMDVKGQEVVLHEAPIFRLVLASRC